MKRICSGIGVPNIYDFLRSEENIPERPEIALFVQAFASKGRFKDLMERIPIHVITTRAALAGAATFGLQSLSSFKRRAKAKAPLAPVKFA